MGSHYFDTDTRRFFRSRVLSWLVMNDGDPREPFGFLVRESRGAGFDPSDGREYAVSVWCRFGSLVAQWRGMRDGVPVENPEQPFTVVESVRAITRTTSHDEAVRLLAACDCHGCQVWGHPWLARACEGCDAPAGEACAVDCLGTAPSADCGTCDTCAATYETSSRDGRCGDCGDCSKCCAHAEAVCARCGYGLLMDPDGGIVERGSLCGECGGNAANAEAVTP